MALTDLKIRKAKAQEKPYKLYDSLGLFVLVNPSGSKLWRQKYQLDGKERVMAHGSYRAFTLEVDRGTEPITSRAARKSLRSSAEMYAEVIGQGLYRRHYGLKANLLVLWVFESNAKKRAFLELVRDIGGPLAQSTLCQVVPGAASSSLYGSGWCRADGAVVRLDHKA